MWRETKHWQNPMRRTPHHNIAMFSVRVLKLIVIFFLVSSFDEIYHFLDSMSICVHVCFRFE